MCVCVFVVVPCPLLLLLLSLRRTLLFRVFFSSASFGSLHFTSVFGFFFRFVNSVLVCSVLATHIQFLYNIIRSSCFVPHAFMPANLPPLFVRLLCEFALMYSMAWHFFFECVVLFILLITHCYCISFLHFSWFAIFFSVSCMLLAGLVGL